MTASAWCSMSCLQACTWPCGAPSCTGVLHRGKGAAHEGRFKKVFLPERPVPAACSQDDTGEERGDLQCHYGAKLATAPALRFALAC